MRPFLMPYWARLAALLAALALACGGARADTPIALFKSFAGNVNFVGTQKTMRTKANAQDACAVVSAATAISATLSGIPSGATILSAQLYWAASNTTPDNTVTFDGTAVSAPAGRQYLSATIGSGFTYYGGAADVTAQVAAKGNGSYSFSGVNVNNGSPYCASEGVLGGFSLLVVYAHPSETFRVLNLYEGFQYIRYNSVTLSLSNFQIPNPIGTATGRIGHITWEGDATLGSNGEDLLFNNVEMTDALNPSQNQFNSASSINNDANSYGIDFDAYTVTSPTLQGGQTTAATIYRSGQDLVLLNAEIIAVPNVPVADLSIAMTLDDNPLTLGQGSTYRLTVANNGPSTESGPIVVNDTLPAQFSVASAGGAGWTCTIASQTVTCTYPGALAVGAALAPIAITGTVTAMPSGNLNNSATVDGQLFDNGPANSTATISASVGTPGYILTDAVCANGIGFGSASQPCHIVVMKPQAAGAPLANLYITALTNGVPTAKNKNNTNVSMQFALSCQNPAANAGKQATFTSAFSALPVCAANGANPTVWTTAATVAFPGNSPTVNVNNSFSYPDVGVIELFMKDSVGVSSTGPFVSYPAMLKVIEVKRTSDGVVNPGGTLTAGYAFVRAGEAFTISVGAFAANGIDLTPNFGKEGATISFSQAAGVGVVANPPLTGGFNPIVGGQTSGTAFSWSEVGALILAPKLTTDDYLGSGTAGITRTPVTVGRFYPDHFDTVVTAPMGCMPNMACPASAAPYGAAYARQPFTVTVTARNLAGEPVTNFANGGFARAVTLSAYSQPGGTVSNPPATGAGLAAGSATIATTAFAGGVASTALPSYTLPTPFISTLSRALNWTGPTPVYLRAEATEATGATTSVTVTSKRASGTLEGGITIVNGRLRLQNSLGSELLKMPVRMDAQYWTVATGTLPAFWENNLKDGASVVAPATVKFPTCIGNICKAGSGRGIFTTSPVTLTGGAGIFRLKAPGAGYDGSLDVQMDNPAWLPSTVARMTFGIYRSPLIYLREVY